MKEFTLTAIYEAVCQCHDSSFEEKLQCLSNNNCPKFSDKELITIFNYLIFKFTKAYVPDNPAYSDAI